MSGEPSAEAVGPAAVAALADGIVLALVSGKSAGPITSAEDPCNSRGLFAGALRLPALVIFANTGRMGACALLLTVCPASPIAPLAW